MNLSLVVVPTYNESSNIASLLEAIWKASPDTHILVVDDNSPDGTAQIVKDAQARHSDKLHLLQRPGKNGLGTAYLAGFRWALDHNYDKIIQMDADFSHDPEVLPTMIRNLDTSPVVIGSRYIEGGGTLNWSLIRKCISKMGTLYARTILGVPINDFTGGFNGWTKKTLSTLDLNAIKSQGYSFQIEMKYRAYTAKFGLKEIPITFHERRSGQSKMSFKIILEAIRAVWRLKNS